MFCSTFQAISDIIENHRHRSVLLDGKLIPHHPELLYPLVVATDNATRIAAVHGDIVVNPGKQVPA